MNSRASKLLIALWVMLLPVTQLQAKIQAEDVEQPQHNFPVAQQLSGSILAKKKDDYLQQRGWRVGDNPRPEGSFYLGWGEADIAVGVGDIAFPDARVAAFEQALLEAKGEFVKFRKQSIAVETLSRNFMDDRPIDPATINDDRSRLKVIGEKLLEATEVGLDKLITELGGDPAALDKTQKRILADRLLTKTIAVNAVAGVSGLRPIATFEDGGRVGVLVVYSDSQRELARSIAAGTAVPQPAKAGGGTIQQMLFGSIADDKAYPFQHGVRLLFDNTGNPWLVAFGQAGVKATNQTSKLKLDMMLQGSRQAAGDLARAQLAEFLKGSVNLASKTEFLSQAQIAEVAGEAGTEEQESVNIGKLVDKTISQFAKVTMTGLVTLKSWTVNHPDTGHLIVGEVVAWSPVTQASARQQRPSSTPAAGATGKAPSVPVRSGADFESNASF